MSNGYVGVLTVDLHLPSAHSLKDKRREVKRVAAGLARRFSCSVAEVDGHDRWQLARMTAAVVTRDAPDADRLTSEALNWLDSDPEAQVVRHARDVIAIGTDEMAPLR